MNIETLKDCIAFFTLEIRPEHSPSVQSYFSFYGIDFESRLEGLEHYFGFVNSSSYNIACHYYSFSRANKTVLINHGYYDHSGQYKHLIEFFLRHELNVIIYDLPGHGLSSGERASIDDFNNYQTVLKSVLGVFSDNDVKVNYIVGQSTGAAIVMHYLFDHPKDDMKVVLLAPLLKSCNWGLSIFIYRLIHKVTNRIPRRFTKNSHDKKFLNFLKNKDPLQSRYTHLNWVAALIKWLAEFKYFRKNKNHVLILQGTNDKTVAWRYNIPAINKKMPNSEVHFIEEARHQLVNESVLLREQMLAHIKRYLEL